MRSVSRWHAPARGSFCTGFSPIAATLGPRKRSASIALCREHGLPQEAEWSRSFQGSALISLGRIEEGLALLRDSVAVQERLETYLARPMFLAVLADSLLKAERVDEGLAAVSEGFAFAARTGEGGVRR